jgi:hypothetical protein
MTATATTMVIRTLRLLPVALPAALHLAPQVVHQTEITAETTVEINLRNSAIP